MSEKKKTAAEPVESAETITAYKGFGADWTCRGYQYAVGKTYAHEGAVQACESGFHACEYPLHVLRYYRPGTSRFAVVEQSGQIARHGDDSKVASSRIAIKAEIDIAGLIKAAVEYTVKRSKPEPGATTDKEHGAVSASGNSGAATASGDYGAATASGNFGAATASGDSGAATASGDSGAATASGYSGAATASGYSGAATASGNSGAATASGNYGAATASGRNGKARGRAGCALFLTYRDSDWKIVHAKALIVGRDGIKPNTYYSLDSAGNAVEVS